MNGGPITHTSARRAARRRSDSKAGPLGVEDWIEAANDLLISENVRGVQVSALCMKLEVTKGSFYWHFASRQDLLRALLASWRRRMTLNIATRVGRAATGAAGTIRTLLALPRKTFSAAGAAIEMSIRDWGGRSLPTTPSRRSTGSASPPSSRAFKPSVYRRETRSSEPTSPTPS